MPRRGPVSVREIEPDLIYGDKLVSRLINHVMRKGKKSLAEKIVYKALDIVKKKTREDPVVVFKRAVENSRPLLEVRPRRVGGATYQVPMEVSPRRGETLAIRWIVQAARSKEGKAMYERLADEILASAKGEGDAVRQRENLHKMAEANRAFAHYRW
jgi:small subunit ribosomal protein S7